MEFTALQIAEVLNGKVEGNSEVTISRLAKIEEGLPGTVTFLANPLYTQFIYTTKASIVVVNKDFIPNQPINATLVRVENSYAAFARLQELFNSMFPDKTGISPLAFISKDVQIGDQVFIGEFAYIGEHAVIGNHTHKDSRYG